MLVDCAFFERTELLHVLAEVSHAVCETKLFSYHSFYSWKAGKIFTVKYRIFCTNSGLCLCVTNKTCFSSPIYEWWFVLTAHASVGQLLAD